MAPTILPLPPEARAHLRHAAQALRAHSEPTPPLLQLSDGLHRLADAGLATDTLGFACLWPIPVALPDPKGGADAAELDLEPVGSDDLVGLLDEWAHRGVRSAAPAPGRIAGRLAQLEGACAALRQALQGEPPWDLAALPRHRLWALRLRAWVRAAATPPSPAAAARATLVRDWSLVRDPYGLPAVRGMVEGSRSASEPGAEAWELQRVWDASSGLVRLSGLGLVRLGAHESLRDPAAVGLLLERAQAECWQLDAALCRGRRKQARR